MVEEEAAMPAEITILEKMQHLQVTLAGTKVLQTIQTNIKDLQILQEVRETLQIPGTTANLSQNVGRKQLRVVHLKVAVRKGKN